MTASMTTTGVNATMVRVKPDAAAILGTAFLAGERRHFANAGR